MKHWFSARALGSTNSSSRVLLRQEHQQAREGRGVADLQQSATTPHPPQPTVVFYSFAPCLHADLARSLGLQRLRFFSLIAPPTSLLVERFIAC